MERLLDGKRIFLVEDDILNIGVFSRSLAGHGALIYQDVLGYGIVQHIVDSLPIDLIVLDIMLRRGQNGFEIFEAIKAHPKLKDIPVVTVTSLDPEIAIPKARDIGLNGFISKPIDAIAFPSQIVRVLEGERVWIVSR